MLFSFFFALVKLRVTMHYYHSNTISCPNYVPCYIFSHVFIPGPHNCFASVPRVICKGPTNVNPSLKAVTLLNHI